MDLRIGIVLFTVLSSSLCGASTRLVSSQITVTNGGRWGVWGPAEFCRKGHAHGFSLKVLSYQGILGDDTGLEGVRLHCTDGSTAESSSGPWGTWSDVQKCPKGNLMSFSLRVSEPKGPGDDTAANNMKFMCQGDYALTGRGHAWGKFGEWSSPCNRGSICGLQTRVETPQGIIKDDTALNDVKFFCCV